MKENLELRLVKHLKNGETESFPIDVKTVEYFDFDTIGVYRHKENGEEEFVIEIDAFMFDFIVDAYIKQIV